MNDPKDAPAPPALTKKPKPSCAKCHGRGFIGTMDVQEPGRAVEKVKVPCKCVKPRP